MSIMNVLKSIDLPVIGKSMYRTEDQFLPSTAMGNGIVKTDATIPQEIIIACKGKRRRVTGYLAEGVKLNGVSNWEPMTSNSLINSVNNLIGNADTLGQLGFAGGNSQSGNGYGHGTSIQQPWMNRKFWKGSNPFTLDFTFNFVAEESAKDEVFLPAQALLSFLYPREIDAPDRVKKLEQTFESGKEKFASAMGGTTTKVNNNGNKTITEAAKDAFKFYAIPGPSLLYGAKGNEGGENDNGDAVTIVVGNMFAFGACYLKQVNLEFSPNFDYTGYPVWCKCTVNAEAMDSNICNKDGSFSISQMPDSASGMAELLKSLTDFAQQAVKDMGNIAKATANAIGAFGQIFED